MECNAAPQQHYLRKRASIQSYMCIDCLVFLTRRCQDLDLFWKLVGHHLSTVRDWLVSTVATTLQVRSFHRHRCWKNRAWGHQHPLQQTHRFALGWLHCLVDSEETVTCFLWHSTVSIETPWRLKTTLCVYGDILCAIRQPAPDGPMQGILGDIEIVKLEATVRGIAETQGTFPLTP